LCTSLGRYNARDQHCGIGERDRVLKEEARHEIEEATEGFRWHGFQTVATTLEYDRHEDPADGHGK
jgi:hypothetical protein